MFKKNARIADRLFQLPYAVNIPSHNVLSAFTTKPASHSAKRENKRNIKYNIPINFANKNIDTVNNFKQ